MNAGKMNGQDAIVPLPERWKILDGSSLKVLAAAAMLVDHIAAVLLRDTRIIVFRLGTRYIDLYDLMRMFGRISFPLFAFLLVEGFVHTRSVKRYGGNLLLFALLSEIPWNLEHSGTLLYGSQNVMFTLLFGLLGLWVIRDYQGSREKKAAALVGLLALSVLFRADYGCAGFGFILMLYLLRDQKLLQAVVGCCFLPDRWVAGLAFVPISLYSTKRGFIRGKPLKYAFYLVYPLHLLALFWIKKMTIGY